MRTYPITITQWQLGHIFFTHVSTHALSNNRAVTEQVPANSRAKPEAVWNVGSQGGTTELKLPPVSQEEPIATPRSGPTTGECSSVGYVHIGVVCNGCNINPIRGRRFKSQTKNNFDMHANLCEMCVHKEPHKIDNYRVILLGDGSCDAGSVDTVRDCTLTADTNSKK